MKGFTELWPGGPVYRGDAVVADSLALADFAGQGPAKTACDLGCGSGLLMLLPSCKGKTLNGQNESPEFCSLGENGTYRQS